MPRSLRVSPPSHPPRPPHRGTKSLPRPPRSGLLSFSERLSVRGAWAGGDPGDLGPIDDPHGQVAGDVDLTREADIGAQARFAGEPGVRVPASGRGRRADLDPAGRAAPVAAATVQDIDPRVLDRQHQLRTGAPRTTSLLRRCIGIGPLAPFSSPPLQRSQTSELRRRRQALAAPDAETTRNQATRVLQTRGAVCPYFHTPRPDLVHDGGPGWQPLQDASSARRPMCIEGLKWPGRFGFTRPPS